MSDRWRLFDDFEAALALPPDAANTELRVDLARAERSGIPEVVYAASKQPEQIIAALVRLAEPHGRALASRCSPSAIDAIESTLGGEFDVTAQLGTVIIARPQSAPPNRGGRVGLITAGTSDLIVATEARVMAEEMGCRVIAVHDAGVAGLHRMVSPLRAMAREDVDAIIVAAGMDGALPSVIAGLVPVPVIGLPVSTGYGFGGNGEAAMGTMLQSCAPGLAVVNVDNGMGAGSFAALIANRVAANRHN